VIPRPGAARAKSVDNEVPQLEREASRLRAEITRLVQALASVDLKPEAVIQGIAERQDQLSALEACLKSAKAAPSALDLEVRRLEKEGRRRLGDLRAMLERNPDEGRKVLETILGARFGSRRSRPRRASAPRSRAWLPSKRW